MKYLFKTISQTSYKSPNPTPYLKKPSRLRHVVRPLFVLTIFLFSLLACNGVTSCIPGCASNDKVSQIAEHFPEDTEAAFYISEIAAVLLALDGALTFDDMPIPIRRRMSAKFNETNTSFDDFFGFEPSEPSAWKDRGIALNAPIFAGLIEDGVVFCIPIKNRDKFEIYAIETLAPALLVDDSTRHREEKVGDHLVHTFDDELAWGYLEDSACGTLANSSSDQAPGPLIAQFLDGLDGEKSLADNPTFREFQSNIFADSHFAGFEAGPDNTDDGWDADGTGIAAHITDDLFHLRLWMSLPTVDGEPIDYSPIDHHPINWRAFANTESAVALRLSLHPEYMWKDFRASTDEETLRRTDNLLSSIREGTNYNIDIEEDFIENLSGELGLFIYGTGDAADLIGDDVPDFNNDFRALVILQFIEADYLDDLLDRLLLIANKDLAIDIERRTIRARRDDQPAIDAVALAPFPFTIYRQEELLLIATNALTESAVTKLLNDSSGEAPLSNENSELGAPFAEEEHFNGIFMHHDGVQLLSHILEIEEIIPADLQEASLKYHETETSIFFDADFYPSAAAIPSLSRALFDLLGEQYFLQRFITEPEPESEFEFDLPPRHNHQDRNDFRDTRTW